MGTDTGGSVRLPAAYTGTIGFKPSYGLLSRWGVIAYANSLDTVGIFAREVRDVEHIFGTKTSAYFCISFPLTLYSSERLNVHDPKDPTSLSASSRGRLVRSEPAPASLKIGIPLDYNITTLHPTVRQAWNRTLQHLKKCGNTLHPIRLPATQHALSAYYVLAPAEASSNLAKFDGVRYGTRADGIDGTPESVLFANTRSQGFGPEVQRRILLGAFSLSAQSIDNYFIQAQKVRRLVQQDFDNVFTRQNPFSHGDVNAAMNHEGKIDVLVCPTAPSPTPLLSDVKEQNPVVSYMNDVLTVPASLAGLPAINVPIRYMSNGKVDKEEDNEDFNREDSGTIGMQIIGQYGDDKMVLDCAKKLQSIMKQFPKIA